MFRNKILYAANKKGAMLMKRAKIKHVLPKVGTRFVHKSKDKIHEMVVINVNGTIKFKVDGIEFDSMSAAAKYITKTEVNGWKYWVKQL